LSKPSTSNTPHLEAAYAACRIIAKREAKNFYYAFRVLPKHKSDAMCAIYAFMRRADDIADEESRSIPERRRIMASWLAAFRESTTAAPNPVFAAVRDAQARFNISNDLLEQLVQGTTMDLEPAAVDSSGLQTYATFDDLYRYCYLVASVVGLVCIRIFGYTDPRAELLAEKTGIAFQLTNILRDVKEDAERGRIYLPLTSLDAFGLGVADIVATAKGEPLSLNLRAMLRSFSADASEYYQAADELIPLIDKDSRAALWVLVSIYSRLLTEINRQNGDVFTRRVSVSTSTKLTILACGALKACVNRTLG
jgi:phytoene synthase